MDSCTLHWVKNWLEGQDWRVIINGVKSRGLSALSKFIDDTKLRGSVT